MYPGTSAGIRGSGVKPIKYKKPTICAHCGDEKSPVSTYRTRHPGRVCYDCVQRELAVLRFVAADPSVFLFMPEVVEDVATA